MEEDEEYDLYSDNDGSLISENSESFEEQEHEDDTVNEFSRTFENKQITTLKKLKSVLKYNKSLRKRLFIVEQELDRCHQVKLEEIETKSNNEFKNINFLSESNLDQIQLDNTNKNIEIINKNDILPIKTKNKKQEENYIASTSQPAVVDNYNLKTNSQFCQTEDDLEEESDPDDYDEYQMTLQEFLFDLVKKARRNPYSKKKKPLDLVFYETKLRKMIEESKRNELAQHEADKQRINQLKAQYDANQTICNELKTQIDSLNQHLTDKEKQNEINVQKLNETNRENNRLMNEVKQLSEAKKRAELMTNEFEELFKENRMKDSIIVLKENQLKQLNESLVHINSKLTSAQNTIEEKEKRIQILNNEIEKNQKERHLDCEKKYDDLYKKHLISIDELAAEKKKFSEQTEILQEYNNEIQKLKVEQQRFNFKDFIALKREVNQLRQEKERKFAERATAAKNVNTKSISTQAPLPPIQESKNISFNFFNN